MPESSSLLVTAVSATSSYMVLIVLFQQKNMNVIMRLVCESCKNSSHMYGNCSMRIATSQGYTNEENLLTFNWLDVE
jgi:hypothetical protein